MDTLDIKSGDICPWALREGIMLHHLANLQVPQQILPLQPSGRSRPRATRPLLNPVPDRKNA
jgi:exopolyphosphatase / guanosine-5'-triphosphate,3'-diphosphate pyrophosphatase